MTRILVVEDNEDLAAGIAYNLELEKYSVRIATSGPQAIGSVSEWLPDLIVLDLMLPGADGYQVLKTIRRQSQRVPVIVVSAKTEAHDRVLAFRLDADDFMTKPFGILDLIERVAALLRRRPTEQGPQFGRELIFDDVTVDLDAHTAMRAGAPVDLAPKEFELLLALVRRKGKVVTRAELLDEIWGGAWELTRTVDAHIARLRRKLDDPEQPRHIITVWKAGYRFVR